MALDIGTLTGTIDLDDQFSKQLAETINRTEDSFKKLGSAFQQAGTALTLGITAPLVGAATASLMFSGTFEASMTRLVSLAGVSQTELVGVKDHILALAPAVGIGPQALADAMTRVSSVVSDTKVAMSILDIAAKGSAAGMGTAADVAVALTAVVNSYGAENMSAAKAGDILTQTIKDGGAEAKDLAPRLASVVPFAAQLGISFEEVGANIATVTKLGVPAAEAVTQLSSVMSALTKENKNGRDALASIGMSYASVRQEIREKGLAAALQDIQNKFGGNTSELVKLFGRLEAVKDVLAVTGAQSKTYTQVLDNMKKSTGALDSAFESMRGTQVQTWNQVVALVQVVAIKFGDALAPSFKAALDAAKPLLDRVIDMADWFGKLDQPVRTVIIAFAALLAALGPALYLIGAISSGIGALSFILVPMGSLISAFGVAFLPMAPAAIAVVALSAALYKVYGAIRDLYAVWKSGGSMWDFFTKQDDNTFARRWLGLSKGVDGAAKSLSDIELPANTAAKTLGDVPPPAGPEKLNAFQKKVESLVGTLTGTSVSVKVVTAAFAKLTDEQKANSDTQEAMLQALLKLRSAHQILTPAMEKTGLALITQHHATIDTEVASLRLNGTTMLMINTMKAHGDTEDEIAFKLGVSKDALKLFQDQAADLAAVHKLEGGLSGLHTAIADVDNSELQWIKTHLAVEEALKKVALEIKNVEQSIPGAVAGFETLGTAELQGIGRQSTEIPNLLKGIDAANKKSHEWGDTLHSLSDMFVKLGQAAGNALGEILSGMGQIAVMMSGAEDQKFLIGKDVMGADGNMQAGEALGGNFGYASTALNSSAKTSDRIGGAAMAGGSIISGVSEIADATSSHKTAAGNALGGALAGAKMGAAFGPYGMAIGAAAGLIVGIIRGKPEWAKAADDVGRDFGVKISDALAKEIAALEKSAHTTRVGAELMSLSAILKEAGGLSSDNLTLMTSKMHDVFSMIETHQLTVAQGAKIMDENFATFAEHSTSSVGVLNASMQEIIKLNSTFKTDSKAIADYIGGQLTNAETNFAVSLGVTSNAITKRADLVAQASKMRSSMDGDEVKDMAKLADLRDKYAKADLTHKMAIQIQMDAIIAKNQDGFNSYVKITDEIAIQDKVIALTSLHTQGAVDAVAMSILGMIGSNVKAGMSFVDSVNKSLPSINALQTQLEATGMSGGDAFDFIRSIAVMASDEIAGPALKAVNGYSAGMVGLANAGMLNQTSFMALSSQISGTEVALEKEGYSHEQVMASMQVDLQRVWELQHQYGYKVDETTQTLLNEGVAAGIVGEKQQSASDRMVTALDRVVAVLEAMGIKLGALPAAAATAASGITTNFDKVHPVINYSYRADNQPDFNPEVPMAAGGAGYAAGPMTFTTKGNEFFAFGGEGGGPIQGSGQQDNSELLAEMQRQRAELAALRRDLTFTVPNYTAKAVAMAIQKS